MHAGRRNEIVRLNEQVKSNWAQVDVVLQRRADLIPNLVATVQGFAAHEQTVFDGIAKARTQYMNAQTPADKIATSNQIYPLELKVLALSENSPQLKSNENFLRLQDELAEPKTVSPSSASVTTIPFGYNTYVGYSPTTSSPDGPASSATTITSRPPKHHAKLRKSNSRPRSSNPAFTRKYRLIAVSAVEQSAENVRDSRLCVRTQESSSAAASMCV